MANRAKRCLEDGEVVEAIEIALRKNDVLKWRDEERFNFTLMHYAAFENCMTFLEAVLKDEKVFIIFMVTPLDNFIK